MYAHNNGNANIISTTTLENQCEKKKKTKRKFISECVKYYNEINNRFTNLHDLNERRALSSIFARSNFFFLLSFRVQHFVTIMLI